MQSDMQRAMTEYMAYQEQGNQQQWAVLDDTRSQARDTLPLSGFLITQITGATQHRTVTIVRNKVRFFDDWLTQNLPDAKHVLAEESGHAIFCAEPELVLYEIRAMVEALREPRGADQIRP